MAKQKAKLLRMPRSRTTSLATVEPLIKPVRHHRVILDSDLAKLYGVSVGRLNEQVKRNRKRFPGDFIFRLTAREAQNLKSQIAISSLSHGGRRTLPYAFTEHGAIMAATVLNSKRAIQMSLFVVRAFVRLREALAANHQLAAKLAELERRLDSHDGTIQEIIEAIRQLMQPPAAPPRKKLGFELPAGHAEIRPGLPSAFARRN